MGTIPTIFEESRPGYGNAVHAPRAEEERDKQAEEAIPERFLRRSALLLPEVSELQVVRHMTRLSQRNYAIDSHFYPLGSCTMKYNPRVCHVLAMDQGFLRRHPLAPEQYGQGLLASLYELQEMLCQVTGMCAFSLTPMAGAQGEFAGVAMIRAYHRSRQDQARREILIPDAAHGTNPATASLCGLQVREIPTTGEGDIDLVALRAAVGPQTAGLMLTNPSTLGVFERQIEEVARIVHQAGGLLYYDGANLNAIIGKTRPGDMGFDAIHVNVHKTFATPHGGGGPGAGPVGVNATLQPFLPVPLVERDAAGQYRWVNEQARALSIGSLSAFMGNSGVLLRAYIYLRMVGGHGLHRIADFSTLNANYLLSRLQKAGFRLAYPQRRASHEFILTLQHEAKSFGVTALDVAKRLLDYGVYAPTVYFPLLVPECLLIEPTETETLADLDHFVEALIQIRQEMLANPGLVKGAPYSTPVQRLDDTLAARKPDLVWKPA